MSRKLFILEGSLQGDGEEDETWGILFYSFDCEPLLNYLRMIVEEPMCENYSWGCFSNNVHVVGHDLKAGFIEISKTLGYELIEIPIDNKELTNERNLINGIKCRYQSEARREWFGNFKPGR